MKISPSPRYDSIDRERFRSWIESPAFQIVQQRFRAELQRATATCMSSDNLVDIRRAQGAAAALKTVLDLPGRLLAEMTAGVKG